MGLLAAGVAVGDGVPEGEGVGVAFDFAAIDAVGRLAASAASATRVHSFFIGRPLLGMFGVLNGTSRSQSLATLAFHLAKKSPAARQARKNSLRDRNTNTRYLPTMRAVLQRVSSASVTIENEITGAIAAGLLVFLGVEETDTADDIDWLAAKIVNLRLFHDDTGVMNRSVLDSGGGILLISQFTLFASTKKGTRPSWHRAANPDRAIPLYEAMITRLNTHLDRPIATGRFGARMEVSLVNDGPVTLLLDTKARE
jgi:D-tyrosyl-tRNA(Tyr) deacylase